LKEGEKVILQNTIEKALYNRDIVRMKISIPYDFKISKLPNKISEINLNFQSVLDNFELKFYQPTLNSIINYNIFLRILKNSFIVAQVVGFVYFSFKIFEKYFLKKFTKRNKKKNLLALPPAES
jgi:ABC-type maltose transport system permease subunit